MAKLLCVKCGKTIRRIKGGRDYASICDTCVSAIESKLTSEQRLAMAKTGLDALIDEATGYDKLRPTDALKKRLEYHSRRKID